MRILGAVLVTWLAVGPAAADFVDVTPAEVDYSVSFSYGSQWMDIDRDGDLEIVRTAWSSSQTNRVFRNDGNNTFEFVVDPAFQRSSVSSKGGSLWWDRDLDGDLDAILSESSSAVFLEQVAPLDFEFDESIAVSGGRSAILCDWDGDVDLDFVMGSFIAATYFRNDGGSLVEVPDVNDLASQGTTSADYNRDGLPDFYFGSPGELYRNDGGGTFSLVSTPTLAATSYPQRFVDLDNDGDLDLVIGTISTTTPVHVFRNDGDDAFADVTAETGDLAAFTGASVGGVDFGDIDNDGDPDLVFGTQAASTARLMRNDGDFVFNDISTMLVGLEAADGDYQHASFGDSDRDGDLDLWLSGGDGVQQLFRNDDDGTNNFLHVVLDGGNSGLLGINSWIEVTTNVGTQTRYVGSGHGWMMSETHDHHFGVGTATTADVVVSWRAGGTTTLNDVPVNQTLVVKEAGAMSLTTQPFTPGVGFDFVFDPGVFSPPTATLFYREGGSTSAFIESNMNFVAGPDNFQDAIPGGLATANGIEYFVRLNDTGTFPYGASASKPAFLPARLDNVALAEVPAAGQYEMFGLPFVANNASPSVLEGSLGAYNPSNWRLFRFDPLNGSNGSYREFGSAGTLDPGKGFWIVMANPVAFTVSGTSTPTPDGVTLQIERGWNQIANPYQFELPITTIDFSSAPNVEQTLNTWDAGGYETSNELEVFEAAFVFNPTAVAETIFLPGINAGPSPSPRPQWDGPALTVDTWQPSWADRENVAGYADAASVAPDRLDRHAPPAPPGALRTYFERLDVDGAVHELNRDLQPMTGGATWDLVVEAPTEETVQLRVSGLDELPVGHRAVLIPAATAATIELGERADLTLPGGQTHRFRLVAGPADYVRDVSEGRGGFTPVQFSLGLGYPNPFSAQTKIGFALPREEKVEVVVFDVTGRRVRQLVNGAKAAGQHVVEWDGVDETGRAVAPGVYFVQMQAGSFSDARKVMVQR